MTINWETTKTWGWRILQGAGALAIIAAVAYWFFAATPVIEHRVEVGEVVAEVLGTGTLEARIKSTISPKIAGRVHEILVDQGDRVKAGQLLFSLDDAELEQQVEIAEATTAMWRASLDRLQADLNQAKAILENAKTDFDRIQKLVQSNAVSAEEGENATERVSIAEAGLSRSMAALVEGQKQITTAERTHAYHQARLADTRVNAPFDGLVVKRHSDQGDIGVPGTPILTLISTDEIWVSAWVDETEMSRIKSVQPARVVFRSESSHSYPATVSRLGREADRETREFVVDVLVTELPANWAVGQRADVYIEVDRRVEVPVIPAEFVVWHEKTPGVYRLVEDRSQWRAIQLGLRSTTKVEIVDGLALDDIVVVPAENMNLSLDNKRVKVSK